MRRSAAEIASEHPGAPSSAPAEERRSTLLLLLAFGTGILTQRLGLWVSGFPVALSLFLLAGSTLALALTGVTRLHWGRVFAFYAVFCATTASAFLNAATASFQSYVLLLGLYAPLCFHAPLSEGGYRRYYSGVVLLAAALSAGGLAQYLLQFLVANREVLFSWKSFVPESFLIEYATINQLNYYSDILKSNGLVFLEPSAFSQFLARVVLISVIVSVQRRWIPLLVVALLATYGGTGMMLLGVFLPLALLTPGVWRGFDPRYGVLLAGALLAVLAIAPATGLFDLNLLVARLGEFGAPGSSGYARYGSTPLILEAAFEDNPAWTAIIFGLGPGQTEQFLTGYSFEVFATAWVKLLIEFGVAGLFSVIAFLTVCLWTGTRSVVLTGAFLAQFLILDGNLLVPQHVLLMAFLATLPSRAVGEYAAIGRQTAEPVGRVFGSRPATT